VDKRLILSIVCAALGVGALSWQGGLWFDWSRDDLQWLGAGLTFLIFALVFLPDRRGGDGSAEEA